MDLREALVASGHLMDVSLRKCLCPFHNETRPSAYVNQDSVHCFACSRTFSLYEIQKKLGVTIEATGDYERDLQEKSKEPMFILYE